MNGLKRSLVEGHFLLDVRKGLDYYGSMLIRKIIYSFGKVKKNKIFIMTYDFRYTCNPKYIVDELLRQKVKCEIVWVCDKKGANTPTFPPQVKTVNYTSGEMFEEMATSKIWIENALGCEWFNMPKKPGQVLINTWHGSMGIKQLSGNAHWLSKARRAKKITTYCITNSKFEEDVFRSTFWPNTEFKKFGHARNDLLIDDKLREEAAKRVYDFYELDADTQIALYAPTFRDTPGADVYNIDFDVLKAALEKRFGGKWVILKRAHFKDSKKSANEEIEQEFVLNGTIYPDMQDLMAAVDVGITDYSSWAYDFILTRKPLFIYAEDIEDYRGGRGFYFPIESTPFPIAQNNKEMGINVENFDNDKYLADVEDFLKDKGCYEEGQAAKRTVELIKEIIGEK